MHLGELLASWPKGGWRTIAWLAVTGAVLIAASGCAGPDENPASARPGRGYVDLYTQPRTNVWWKVDVFDSQRQDYKEFTAQFKAPEQGVFRVEARPGRRKARITFVNQPVERPAEVEVEIRDGMVTPICVTMEPVGQSQVRDTDDRLRWERSRTTDYSQQVWRISASAQSPVAYVPKQNVAYWK